MKVQILKTTIAVILLALVLFFINLLFLENTHFNSNFELYQVSLEFIYFIFTLFSIVILIILLIVNQKNKDVVGMTFMLITTFKTILSYVLFSKIITGDNENTIERINFFVVFILFLIIETLITILLLNKKQ
jgi:hypothetical protein